MHLERFEADFAKPFEDELALPEGCSPLQFLMAVYRDPSQPMARRMKAAEVALPFTSPKLAVTALIDERSIGDRLEARLRRIAGDPGGGGGRG